MEEHTKTGQTQSVGTMTEAPRKCRELVKDFLERLTREQWIALKHGQIDSNTMFLIAELILDIVSYLAMSFNKKIKRTALVSEQLVNATLGQVIRHCFMDVLQVNDEEETDELEELIHSEFMQNVISSVSASESPSISSLDELDKMVGQVSELLIPIAAERKDLCTPTDQLGENIIRVVPAGHAPLEPRSVASSTSSGTSARMEELLSKELEEIVEPLLPDMPEHDLLQPDYSLECKAIAADIIQSIPEVKTEELAGKRRRQAKRASKSLKEVGAKIRRFFTKAFVRVSIHHIVDKVKKNSPQAKKRSTEEVKTLMENVDSVLQDGQSGGVCVFHRPHDFTDRRVLVITHQLSELLYTHITGNAAMGIRKPKGTKSQTCNEIVTVAHRDTYADIENKVVSFLLAVRWWMNQEAEMHSNKVLAAYLEPQQKLLWKPEVKDIEEALVIELPEFISINDEKVEETEPPVDEIKEFLLKILVMRVVARTLKKAKVESLFGDSEIIIQCLFERAWAEVENRDIKITPKSLKGMDKKIYKDLCKRWDSAERLTVAMMAEEHELGECFASSVKSHLVKKRNICLRFFSWCCGGATKTS